MITISPSVRTSFPQAQFGALIVKGIPPVGIPVEVMFLAEVKNQLLTAGHDLDMVQGNLCIDISVEPQMYKSISGREQQLAQNDLYLCDEAGVLSSIIGGPDDRTQITTETKNALYFVYGVEGITSQGIEAHLKTIASYLSKTINGVQVEHIEIQ